MRLTFPLVQERNPIALRERRAYERAVPLWARRLETVGVIAAALSVCLGLVLYWLHARARMPLHFIYQLMGFETSAVVQIAVGVVYGATLLRCTFAGVSVANHYQRDARDDLALTGLTTGQIVRGQWTAALYQVRGWLVALGLVRFMAVVLMLAEYQFNVYWNHLFDIASSGAVCCNSQRAFDYGFAPAQLPLALIFAIVLGLLEVGATTGIGLLMGSRIRSSASAWAAAIGLRALPILIFTGFPLISGTSSYDLLAVRWYEYTWFAFADGGTGALLRLTLPMRLPYSLNGWAVTRGLLAFLAAAHMLLIAGLGTHALMTRRWRRLREAVPIRKRPPRRPSSSGNVAIVGMALAICIWLPIAWSQRAGGFPATVGSSFFYDPAFLGWLEDSLWIAIGVTTLAAILAGVRRGRAIRARGTAPAALPDLLREGAVVFRGLRGWWLGLGFLLMTAYGVLIAEHLVNFQTARLYDCAFSQYHNICGYTYFGWPFVQWVIGLGMIVALSGAIVLGSALWGLGAGIGFRSARWALIFAVAVRLIPVVLGLLPPDAQTPDSMDGILNPRWHQDPLLVLADSGVSVVFGMAEPYWHTGHVGGRTNVAYGLLAFTLLMYVQLGYGLGSLGLARWTLRRRARGLSPGRMPVTPSAAAGLGLRP